MELTKEGYLEQLEGLTVHLKKLFSEPQDRRTIQRTDRAIDEAQTIMRRIHAINEQANEDLELSPGELRDQAEGIRL